MKKVNLGCGEFKKEGYVNVDFFSVSKPDLVHNLNEFPYPFSHSEVDLVEMDHVLEHLSNPFLVMKEIHRILKPGGKVKIRVPHFSRGFTHPEHKRGFDVTFPFYFNPSFPGGFQGFQFKLEYMHLEWYAQPYLKKQVLSPWIHYPLQFLSKIINAFANLSPAFTSRIWCFFVGGFEEIEFHLEAVK